MAKRQYQIRWRDSDTAELQRVINNFNAKLYRLKKNHPDMEEYLPARVKKSDIINSISTRADFNRTINSLKRFSKRGAEKEVKSKRGAKSTKWEVEEFAHKQRIENARRARKRKAIEEKEVTSRGKKTGSTRAEMGSIKSNALKPSNKKFDNLSSKEWEYAKKTIDDALNPLTSEFMKHNMRLNYIKGLRNAGFSEDIVSLVHEVDINSFIETVETDTEAEFDFIYDPLDFKVKQQALYDVWENALKRTKGG